MDRKLSTTLALQVVEEDRQMVGTMEATMMVMMITLKTVPPSTQATPMADRQLIHNDDLTVESGAAANHQIHQSLNCCGRTLRPSQKPLQDGWRR